MYIALIGLHLIKDLLDLCIGLGSCKADDHNHNGSNHKCRQQLIDRKGTTQLGNAKLPDEDHDAAGNQASQNTLAIAALPEQRKQDHGTKCSAKACPRKRNDIKHFGTGIPCEHERNKGNYKNCCSCNKHRCFFVHILCDEAVNKVF